MREEEKKKSGSGVRFNLLDAVIILLALLCVVGIWQRRNLQRLFTSDEKMENYTVTFEIKKLRSTTVDLLTKDTVLYVSDGGEMHELGKLTEHVSASAAIVYLQNGKGETVTAVYPQDEYEYLLDVTGTLASVGVTRDGAFLLDGALHVGVNETLYVYTENADLEIRVTNIVKAP